MPVHLHTHSWYSLLEGASSLDALLERAVAHGYTSLALTDTNNLYGASAFVESANRIGIRPLVGARLRQNRWRCTALIADRVGYRNLCRVLSRLNLAGAGPFPPVVLADLLSANADGLHILVDDLVLAERLREAFGGRLWLEIVRPPIGATAGRREHDLLACGHRLGLCPVASTAVHFAGPAEYSTFRLTTAMRRGILLEQLPRVLPLTPDHHLVAPAELRRRFHDLPAAVYNGERLAELLRSDVLPRELILPAPRLRPGMDQVRYLHRLCERGLQQRGLGADPEAKSRLREELAIVEATSLAGYFLIAYDITRWVRRRGHTMALRGSAGNSLVCFLLGITDVDPLRFRLPLERFLYLGRADLPDIDLDFDWKVRDEVIDHVFQRYGDAHVARICTHLFLQPRSAFREAAKLHGLSNEQISELLTTLPENVEDLMQARNADSTSPRFPLEPARWPCLLNDARRLLGRPHHLSLHPGGVVITPGPIEDYVPLEWAAKGVVVTQFEKDAVERVGLVKIDLLGNRALATVDEAKRWAAVEALPCRASAKQAAPDNRTVIDLLQSGDTIGVNQLESPAMRHLLIQMRPRNVEDVVQALALIRPGAALIGAKARFVRRRRGLEPRQPLHPRLAALLGDTENLMIFEDDALQVIQKLTGLAAPDADRFRRRVTKHRTEAEAWALLKEFVGLCARQGVPAAALTEVWAQLSKFNQYSFCKSHAVSYGLIAWQSAILKAHHPIAFWTAALNNNQSAYPLRVYVEAMKRAGVRLLLPCVNRSAGPFRPERGAVRVGLGAIAGLPKEMRERLIKDREQNGPYRDLADFRRRVRPGPETLTALVRCGALDFTNRPRPALLLEADLQDQNRPKGPELLPCRPADDWAAPDYDQRRRLRDEWAALGFIVGPPLMSLFRRPAPLGKGPPLIASNQIAERLGQTVRVEGLVAAARRVHTKDGRLVQFITLEDEQGLTETTLFPDECPAVPYLTMGPYTATGVIEEQYGVYTLTVQSFGR
jgi:DNA polymerase III subunit alpha